MPKSLPCSVLVLLATLLASSRVAAQQPAPADGRIVGRIVDAATGQGLSAVTVQVMGTSAGAISGLDGRFIINNVPAGQVTLRATSLGYAIKTVTEISVSVGSSTEQNIALETEAVAIGALEVTAAAERGSVNRALDQQRNATGIVNAITAEQITRSPDSDAAQAVQRVSGVSVQDGKFVVVRGLGERYTTTSLNGARIPSPEPEKKMVPLDLFPTSLLEQITTSKTFTPDQSGDFSGAQVDIKTREFFGERSLSYSSSISINSAATGRNLVLAPGTSADWLGFGSGSRALPTAIRAAGNFSTSPTQQDINAFVRSFRNTWSPLSKTGLPSGSFGFVLGGNEPVRGQRFGYVVSGTYNNDQEVRANESRAIAQSAGAGQTVTIDRYDGTTGRRSILWGGVANVSTLLGSRSRIALNSTYNHSADNEARYEVGSSENYGNLPLQVTRLRYIERSVRSNQLLGEHELNENGRFDWSITSSGVRRQEPDRSEIVYSIDSDPQTGAPLPAAWFSGSSEGAVRTFGDLSENSWELAANYRISMGATRVSSFKLGALGRRTTRNTDNLAYSITAPMMARSERERSPEAIFNGQFTADDAQLFRLDPLTQGGSYTAADNLLAGYGMLEWVLSPRLRTIAGARVEHSDVTVDAAPTVGAAIVAQPTFTDVLPSLSLIYQPAENQNIRLSATQTLSRPEYRELAGIQYREVIGGENVYGNPDLRRTLIRNVDARYELYPGSGEVISLALFAKFFEDPIERVYLGTSGTRVVTFLNAESGRNYGVELELRKRLGFISDALMGVTAFGNVTLMKSEIDIGNAGSGTSRINDLRPMVGQSPYVINAGLTYSSASGARSATVLYNTHGKRIVSAAELPLPDVYELGRQTLDVALRVPVLPAVSLKLDFKNVLDSPHEVVQGSTIREYYTSGRVISAGVNWRR
jgi:outer membrane receptor protein involved in Fe transport